MAKGRHPEAGRDRGALLRLAQIGHGRGLVWGLIALLFVALPFAFPGGFAITLLSQMGILIVFALSYNMLLGQAGMLSFGHAVYSGMGAFFAIHAMNWSSAGTLWIPLPLIPLVGGFFGALIGVIFGYVTTRKAGTPFAMITLGIGEMVFASSLMFGDFFGGEGGITADRTTAGAFLGLTFKSAQQVYFLIAAWCLLCMIAMYTFANTPLGRIANAVRENPERVEFVGYSTQMVRFIVLIVSAFFAGISGGLSAISFEIVSAENVSAARSGGVLLATFIGGSLFFSGPILGAVIFVLFAVALSDYTKAWQLYLGAFFVLMVMYAPGGVASLVMVNLRVARFGMFAKLRGPYVGVLLSGAVLLLGAIMVIEMAYHLTLALGGGTAIRLFRFPVDAASSEAWLVAIGILAIGSITFRMTCRSFGREWNAVQERIEEQIAGDPRALGR